MVKDAVKYVAAVVVVAILCVAGTAAAVDAPKWVAALYVEAQKVVGLRWMPVPGASGYKVLRGTKSGAYEEVYSGTQPQYLDAKVESGVTYFYVLQAIAGAETSPNSDERSVALAAAKKVEELLPPSLEQVLLQESTDFGKTSYKVGLLWKPAGAVKAIAYNVYRSTEPGKGYEMITSTPELRVTDAKVEEGKSYYYAVSALDESFRESAYSAEKTVAVVKAKKAADEKKKVDKALAIRPTKKIRAIKAPSTSKAFNQVADVLYKDGRIYISDMGNHAIRVFSEAGDEISSFGVEGDGSAPGQLNTPNRLTIDADGNFYITSAVGNYVSIFDDKGGPVGSFFLRSKEDQAKPYGAFGAAIRDGKDEIWVGDLDHHLIEIREASSPYKFVKELKTFKALDMGQIKEMGFATPIASKFRADGKFVVFDALAGKLLLFDPETLELVTSGGGIGSVAGLFTRGGYFDIDEQDRLYVVDKVMCSIQVFDKDLNFLFILGNDKGEQMDFLSSPLGIDVVGNKIFVADRVQGVVVIEMMDESLIVRKEIKH